MAERCVTSDSLSSASSRCESKNNFLLPQASFETPSTQLTSQGDDAMLQDQHRIIVTRDGINSQNNQGGDSPNITTQSVDSQTFSTHAGDVNSQNIATHGDRIIDTTITFEDTSQNSIMQEFNSQHRLVSDKDRNKRKRKAAPRRSKKAKMESSGSFSPQSFSDDVKACLPQVYSNNEQSLDTLQSRNFQQEETEGDAAPVHFDSVTSDKEEGEVIQNKRKRKTAPKRSKKVKIESNDSFSPQSVSKNEASLNTIQSRNFQQQETDLGDGDSAPVHFESVTNEKNDAEEDSILAFQCATCDAAYADAIQLRQHIVSSKHVKASRCGKCSKVFTRCSSLSFHLKSVHTDERRFKCIYCPATFKGHQGLIYHERKHRNETPYSCDICDASFIDSSSLLRHKRSHTGERPYKCELCPSAFSNMSSLTYHMRSHLGIKHYRCQLCPAAFTRPQHLTQHMVHHNSDTPFSCDVCSEAFGKRDDLTAHIQKSHAKDAVYVCDVCTNAFSSFAELNVHKDEHSVFKAFKCQLCPAEFVRDEYLKAHMRKHRNDRTLKCDRCSACFSNGTTLFKHKKLHEEEDEVMASSGVNM